MNRHRLLPLLLLPLLVLAACKKNNPAGAGRVLTSIVITPADPSVADGGTVQLSATLRDQDGQAFTTPPGGVTLNWSSADGAIASVSAAGLVSGERPGQAQVTASAGGVSASTQVTVTQVATSLARVGGDGQQAVEGSALADSLKVRVTDRHGSPVAGVAVQFAVTGGGGSISPATISTDAAGHAGAVWTLGPAAGANAAEARVPGLTGSPVGFTATATPANRPPIARNDAATTPENTPVVIAVLANDEDPDGDPLTVVSVTAPANGAAVIDPGQTVTYTPNPGFTGSDGFGYTISDGRGGSASATVAVTVTALPLICSPIAGFNKTWQGRVDRNWSNSQNWSPVGVPTASDNVFVCAAAVNKPVLTQASVANDLHLRGSLTIGEASLTVSGNFSSASGTPGYLVMQHAAGRATILGNASFGGSQPAGQLSAGTLEMHGDFTVAVGASDRFRPTGSLHVLLAGSTAQTVAVGSSSLGGNLLQSLEIRNPAGVVFTHSVHIRGGVLLGPTAGVVTSSGASTEIEIVGGLVDAGGNRWRAARTRFVDSTILPAEVTTDAHFSGVGTLAADLTVHGNVGLGGPNPTTLDLNGNTLSVAGNYATGGTAGFLVMQNAADRVVILGNASFATSGGVQLTAGSIEVRGNFFVPFGQSDRLLPSGSHRFIMAGGAAQTIDVGSSSPAANRFNILEVRNTAGVTVVRSLAVTAEIDLVGAMTVPPGIVVTLPGTLRLRSGSVLTNNGTMNVGACVKEAGHTINGTDPCP